MALQGAPEVAVMKGASTGSSHGASGRLGRRRAWLVCAAALVLACYLMTMEAEQSRAMRQFVASMRGVASADSSRLDDVEDNDAAEDAAEDDVERDGLAAAGATVDAHGAAHSISEQAAELVPTDVDDADADERAAAEAGEADDADERAAAEAGEADEADERAAAEAGEADEADERAAAETGEAVPEASASGPGLPVSAVGEAAANDDPEAVWGPSELLEGRTRSDLPRTSSRAYNELRQGERYLVYTPSGGFSNQFYCLLGAIYVARLSNRTVVVPPKAKHTNFQNGYWKLGMKDLVPFDHALDFDYMERATGVPLLPLDKPLRVFYKEVLRAEERSSPELDFFPITFSHGLAKAHSWERSMYLKKLVGSGKRTVVAFGSFYNKVWAETGRDWGNVRFSPYLTAFAEVIARRLFRGSPFNAVHVRMGDYAPRVKFASSHFDARAWASRAKRMSFDTEMPLYIATDDTKYPEYFAPIERMFPHRIRAEQFKKDPVVTAWLADLKRRVPASPVFDSLLGMVDQLVCAQSEKFIGTDLSTFTRLILYAREHITKWMPDFVAGPTYRPAARQGSKVVWGPKAYNYHKASDLAKKSGKSL